MLVKLWFIEQLQFQLSKCDYYAYDNDPCVSMLDNSEHVSMLGNSGQVSRHVGLIPGILGDPDMFTGISGKYLCSMLGNSRHISQYV